MNLARGPVEAEGLVSAADNEPVAAKERRTKVDTRNESAPSQPVTKPRAHGRLGVARHGGRVRAIRLGARIRLDVVAARVAQTLLGLAERPAESDEAEVMGLRPIAADEHAREAATETDRSMDEVRDGERWECERAEDEGALAGWSEPDAEAYAAGCLAHDSPLA